jgi:hypothetical protein
MFLLISIFIDTKVLLKGKYDRNTLCLNFIGKTVSHTLKEDKEAHQVVFDDTSVSYFARTNALNG